MDAFGHRILAGTGTAAIFATAGAPPWQIFASAPIGMAFSEGWTSPDLDNTFLLKKLTKWIPGRWDSEIFGHRRTLHWWGWPALIAAIAHRADLGQSGWVVWASLLGWASHLLGDLIFGMPGYGTPEGVPLLPWWGHFGLGFRSDGIAQHILMWPISIALTWCALGHPGL